MKLSAFASIDVVTNEIPRPGVITVVPSAGMALDTDFTFAAISWADPDLPLTFTFAFSDVFGTSLTLQSQSQLSFGRSQLPMGDENNNYRLRVAVVVYDSIGSNNSASQLVTVNNNPINSTALIGHLGNQMSAAAGDASKLNQVFIRVELAQLKGSRSLTLFFNLSNNIVGPGDFRNHS